jgi:TraM recognition site of TraD and TraG
MTDQNFNALPEYHPETLLRDWGNGLGFRIADALTGAAIFGSTGGGKTSGPGRHLAYGLLAPGLGGIVLCSKTEECRQWQKWAADCGRTDDLVIFDASGKWRFNFLEWEASRPGASAGITINIVSILDEIAGAIARSAGKVEGGGDNKFWEDALHHMNTNLVDLPIFAGVQVSLPLMRSIVNTAPQSPAQVADVKWQDTSVCAQILAEADKATLKASADVRADFEECRNYWLMEFPALSEKTRSIITLSFSMLVRPLITRPLRKLFCTDTNIKPEDTFNGKIIIVDLPVQDFRLAGRIANLAFKFCFQIAVLRRTPPTHGYLRPVFLWSDEAQQFITEFDAEYHALCRSAGGCTVYLTQNRENLRRALGSNDAVDALLNNLQAKFFCQNTGETAEWASRLLGEHWINTNSLNVGHGGASEQRQTSGVTRSEQKRAFVEPSRFTTLKRGGPRNDFQVEAIVYNGGQLFPSGPKGREVFLPYTQLTFNQQ